MLKHYSLIRAEKILKFARKYYKGKKDDVSVEAWANCREQGFHFSNYATNRALCVAQARSSDSIVIIFGMNKDFDISTNMPSEATWNNRRYFGWDEDEMAGKWIADYLSNKFAV